MDRLRRRAGNLLPRSSSEADPSSPSVDDRKLVGSPASSRKSMTLCRARPNCSTSAPRRRWRAKALAERKQLRIIVLGSSSAPALRRFQSAFAYPTQLRIGLEKGPPWCRYRGDRNRGIGGQDVEEMAARMRTEMQHNPASLVIWQIGTNAAIRQMPLDKFGKTLRGVLALGKVAGSHLRADEPAVCSCCRSRASDKEAYERVMAEARQRNIPLVSSVATTSCVPGTKTACLYAQFSCSSMDRISTISARSVSASC